MFVNDCVLTVDTFTDFPGEFYIFCRARSARSDYFETVGAFCTLEDAERVLHDMQTNGGRVADYRRVYGG